MRQTITKIKGVTINVEIVETHHHDKNAGLICYIAAIYVQRHGSNDKRLVRKSRVPGAAENLKNEIDKNGFRAFDATCP